jgi:hypothetical protein
MIVFGITNGSSSYQDARPACYNHVSPSLRITYADLWIAIAVKADVATT